VRDFKSTYNSHTGLLCFSGDWTDPVLWSHYAEKHRGICLGFNLLLDDQTQEVKYEAERIQAELTDSDPTQLHPQLQRQLLCTKFRNWEYEEEWRRFVPLEDTLAEGALHFFPFSDSLQLAEVILGRNCDLSWDCVKNFTSALYPDVSVIRGRLADKWFKIVPDESTLPA
jgi:hypothetical protein